MSVPSIVTITSPMPPASLSPQSLHSPTTLVSPDMLNSPTSPTTLVPGAQRPSPQMIMLLAAVKQARLYAVAAVQADMQGEYASAAANYRAAVKSLRNEVANVPEEDSIAFNDRIMMYERRAEMIELIILGVDSTGEKQPEVARLPAIRPDKNSFPEPIPDNESSRTFWLFRALIKTLTTGGFIAPRVFVPRDVWFAQLPNVKIDQLSLKCGSCFTILEFLQKLQQLTDFKDSSLIVHELQDFCKTLDSLQMIFSENLPYIPKPRNLIDERVLKQLKKTVDSQSDSNDLKKYAQALTNLMKEALFLEKWVDYYASIMTASQVNSLLTTILLYFQLVFTPVVLSDLRTLLSKYMRRYEAQMSSAL